MNRIKVYKYFSQKRRQCPIAVPYQNLAVAASDYPNGYDILINAGKLKAYEPVGTRSGHFRTRIRRVVEGNPCGASLTAI